MTEPLEEIQDLILERIHAGERIDREVILRQHPDHADSLRAFLDLIEVIEEEPAEDAPPITRLGEFKIVREIGRGGMGIVYEAEQTSLKRRVALKVLPPTLRMDPRLVSRFRREAEAAGRLRHPGIVPVYSVGEAAGAPFFAMELVDGESLQEAIRRARDGEDPAKRRRRAVEIAAKVADALGYAHGQGILHRDVKPGNIIVDTSGEPRLTDFGLALDMLAPGLTVPGEIFGSPQYMSPEQAVRQEAPVDERTDVYSLAVTLYELVTLRLPYDATTSAELLTALAAGKLVPPRKVDPSVPRALERVLLRALRKDPRERYATAKAFAEDLRACLEAREPEGARAGRAPRWLLWPVVGSAAALALAAFVIFILPTLLAGRRDGPPDVPPITAERSRDGGVTKRIRIGPGDVVLEPGDRVSIPEPYRLALSITGEDSRREALEPVLRGELRVRGRIAVVPLSDPHHYALWLVFQPGPPAGQDLRENVIEASKLRIEASLRTHDGRRLASRRFSEVSLLATCRELGLFLEEEIPARLVTGGGRPELGWLFRIREGLVRKDLAFWLLLERGLDDEESLRIAFDDPRDLELVRQERRRARETAGRFLDGWTELSTDETRPGLEELRRELVAAGPAAAPVLLEVLAHNPYDAFGSRGAHGPTARRQVVALHGLGFLGLKETIPFAVLHCRGLSRTQVSTASLVLEMLTGEDFDAEWLKSPDLWKIDWWAKRAARNDAALGVLVRGLLDDLREGPSSGDWWWAKTGRRVVADLGMLLNTQFPFDPEADAEGRAEQVRLIEAWWRGRRSR